MGSVLVGRDGELSLLRRCVAGVAGGRGASVLVQGAPGVGKSALLTVGLAEAAESGCRVLWAAGEELGRRFPLRPLVDCLDAAGLAGERRRLEIDRLLRGQLGGVGMFGGGDPVTAAGEQVLALVDEVCATAPVVLVVEDLHWADDATVGVWHRLARSVDQLPLLVVGSARTVPERGDVAALRRSAGRPRGGLIELEPLSEPAVLELVAGLAGGLPGPRLAALATRTGGNPLYVTELVSALHRDGDLRVDGGTVQAAGNAAAGSLAGTIGGRVEFLTEPAREVLRSAAVLGRSFTVIDLATVTGRAAAALVAPLREAMTAGVLTEAGASLVFRHELIRDALYQDMPGSLRTALHQDAARTLAAAGAPLDRVAAQVLAAGPVVDAWARRWLASAASALIGQAPEVAVELLRAAVETIPAGDLERNLLAARLAAALYRTGRLADSEQVARATLDWVDDADLVGELYWLVAECLLVSGRFGEILTEIDKAMTVPGLGPVHAARLRVMAARAHAGLAEVNLAGPAAELALAAARATGDPWATGYALNVLAVVESRRGHLQQALPLYDEGLAIAADNPDLSSLRLLLLVNRATNLINRGRFDEARTALSETRRLAEQTGNAPRLAQVRAKIVALEYDPGRWDDVLAEIESGIPSDPRLAMDMHGIAALIALHRDDGHAADRHLTAATPTGAVWDWRVRLARALERERAGHLDQALAVLVELFNEPWYATIEERNAPIGEAVRLAVLLGDRATARELTGQLEESAADSENPARPGFTLFCQGLRDADPVPLTQAADVFRRAGRPLPLAQALEAAADLHVRAGDTVTARRQFDEAVTVYTQLGAVWDIHRADAHFRALGIRRRRRGLRADPKRLTPTETTVAELVTQGLSNPQIADQLFLSRRTVQTHVSHILTKLDVHSRVEIAREFTRSAH